jgi:hypothetical protein
MKIAVIGNFSDRRCGFQSFSKQTAHALRRAGHDVTAFDGTYSTVYARREAGIESFLPPDPSSFDVLHVVWHPATLNHYAGATWPAGPVTSVWNGCPAAWCPFNDAMAVKWGVLGREEGHRQLFYPIPDWITDLPEPDPAFTVGYSGVREDGLPALRELCAKYGWATNFSDPALWLPVEDEIARVARSTVNVGWYSGAHDDRSSGAMLCLASRRPFLCNHVRMFQHLEGYADVYFGDGTDGIAELEAALLRVEADWKQGRLIVPGPVLDAYSWTKAVTLLEEGWRRC